MTPDITWRCYSLTKGQEAASLKVLREIERRGRMQNTEFADLPELEAHAAFEMRMQGLFTERQDGFWFFTYLSPYGELYLKEREGVAC